MPHQTISLQKFVLWAFYLLAVSSDCIHGAPNPRGRATPAPAGGCPKLMSWNPSLQQYATYDKDELSKNFFLFNNVWGVKHLDQHKSRQSTECHSYTSNQLSWSTSFSMVPQSPGVISEVKSYSNAAWATSRRIGDLKRMDTHWSWQLRDMSNDLTTNVAFDLFTSNDPKCPGQSAYCAKDEIMIWLAAVGGARPIGNRVGTSTIKLGDNGSYEFEVWVGRAGVPVYSLVPVNKAAMYTNFKADMLPALRALEHYGLSPSEYIVTVGVGPEAFKGSATLTSSCSLSFT